MTLPLPRHSKQGITPLHHGCMMVSYRLHLNNWIELKPRGTMSRLSLIPNKKE